MLVAAGITAAGVAFWVLLPGVVPMLQPDSAGYLQFSPLRSAPYPVLLLGLQGLGLGPAAISALQMGVYFASLFVLLAVLGRCGWRWGWGWWPTPITWAMSGRS